MTSKLKNPKVLISQSRANKKVKELARKISRNYKGKKLVLVGVLKGAFVFMADLLREITIPLEIDFIQVSSYGASKTSSGVIKIKKDIDLPIVGKNVLLVEDIIDYGYTLDYLIRFLKAKKAKSVGVCVMLDKPARRRVEVPLAYKGFEVPDKFMVGYGLDFAEKFRNLPYVGCLSS
ncbi:MAG: hypoxanthine phosphoribosyltransferase [Candidatus Margulisiibacteriota bacterium]